MFLSEIITMIFYLNKNRWYESSRHTAAWGSFLIGENHHDNEVITKVITKNKKAHNHAVMGEAADENRTRYHGQKVNTSIYAENAPKPHGCGLLG